MKIAIVEDKKVYSDELRVMIERYASEHEFAVKIDEFSDGMNFVSDYKSGYDVVFMDIKMPHLDGMEAARKIRAIDSYVCIVFVTSYAQFAINGYDVGALDYIVKPVSYGVFSIKMDKIIKHYNLYKQRYVILRKDGWSVRVNLSDIKYVESDLHILTYHTKQGDFEERGKLSEVVETFKGLTFARCGVSFLVNLEYVDRFNKNCVEIGEISLPISRGYREEFLQAASKFLKEGKV